MLLMAVFEVVAIGPVVTLKFAKGSFGLGSLLNFRLRALGTKVASWSHRDRWTNHTGID